MQYPEETSAYQNYPNFSDLIKQCNTALSSAISSYSRGQFGVKD